MKSVILLLLYPAMILAVDDPVASLADEYCNYLESSSRTAGESTTIVGEFRLLGKELGLAGSEAYAETMEYVRATAPEINDAEAVLECEFLVMEELITSCPAFLELTRQTLMPGPPASRSLQLIMEDLKGVMEQNTGLPYADQLMLADAEIVSIITRLKKELSKDYTEGFMDAQLPFDLANFLFHHSDEYLRAYMGTVLPDMLELKR
jgi:hypothetical protein